jgi:hypothetical protein
MPAIGREVGLDDFYVAIAYTWSAVLWVLLAPFWAEKATITAARCWRSWK